MINESLLICVCIVKFHSNLFEARKKIFETAGVVRRSKSTRCKVLRDFGKVRKADTRPTLPTIHREEETPVEHYWSILKKQYITKLPQKSVTILLRKLYKARKQSDDGDSSFTNTHTFYPTELQNNIILSIEIENRKSYHESSIEL